MSFCQPKLTSFVRNKPWFLPVKNRASFWKGNHVEIPKIGFANTGFKPKFPRAREILVVGLTGGSMPDRQEPRYEELRTYELLCKDYTTQFLFHHDMEFMTTQTQGGFYANEFCFLTRSSERYCQDYLCCIDPLNGSTTQQYYAGRLDDDNSVCIDSEGFWVFGGAYVEWVPFNPEDWTNPKNKEERSKFRMVDHVSSFTKHFDFETSDQQYRASMKFARQRPGCTKASNGHFYVAGGFQGKDKDKDYNVVDYVEEYCPKLDTWDQKPSLNQKRANFPMIQWGQHILAIGGYGYTGAMDTVEGLKLSGSTSKWERFPALNIGRHGHAAVLMGQDIVVLGGLDRFGRGVTDIEVLSPGSRDWAVVGDLVQPRYNPVAAVFRCWVTENLGHAFDKDPYNAGAPDDVFAPNKAGCSSNPESSVEVDFRGPSDEAQKAQQVRDKDKLNDSGISGTASLVKVQEEDEIMSSEDSSSYADTDALVAAYTNIPPGYVDRNFCDCI